MKRKSPKKYPLKVIYSYLTIILPNRADIYLAEETIDQVG